jgi:hypothetical protein
MTEGKCHFYYLVYEKNREKKARTNRAFSGTLHACFLDYYNILTIKILQKLLCLCCLAGPEDVSIKSVGGSDR